MKRILLFLTLQLFIIMVSAQQSTTDCFVLSSSVITPGGNEVEISVSLVGETIYTGYNMDIWLPEGFDVVQKNKRYATRTGNIYPYTMEYNESLDMEIPTYSHTVSSSYGVVAERVLRVACVSTSNENFTSTSGSLFKFYVKANSYSKPGVAEIRLTGLNLTKSNKEKYVPQNSIDRNVMVSASTSAEISVSASLNWSTCVLPFDAELPDGVTALTSDNYDEENIYLTKAESIKAYTPYVLYSEEGYNGTVSGTVDPEKYPENGYVQEGLLCGAIVPQKVTEGFVLQNLQDGVKFYGIGSGSTFNIPAGKCWMSLPASNAKALNFVVSDVTGITAVNTTTANDDVIYNLQGMKVTTPVAGNIYIRNGKKFAINK